MPLTLVAFCLRYLLCCTRLVIFVPNFRGYSHRYLYLCIGPTYRWLWCLGPTAVAYKFSFNNEAVMFATREKKSYSPVWKFNFVNLCDEQSSKSTCMVAVQYKNKCCLWEDSCRQNSTKLTAHPQRVL